MKYFIETILGEIFEVQNVYFDRSHHPSAGSRPNRETSIYAFRDFISRPMPQYEIMPWSPIENYQDLTNDPKIFIGWLKNNVSDSLGRTYKFLTNEGQSIDISLVTQIWEEE